MLAKLGTVWPCLLPLSASMRKMACKHSKLRLLGGLEFRKDEDGDGGVPFLRSDRLFRNRISENENKEDTEAKKHSSKTQNKSEDGRELLRGYLWQDICPACSERKRSRDTGRKRDMVMACSQHQERGEALTCVPSSGLMWEKRPQQ